MPELAGVLTAMVTPFDAELRLDEGAARSLAAHLVENGSDGLVVAGTTGESPTLSDQEKLALLRAVRDEVGERTTLICGTGTNDTAHSVELSKAAADAGAEALLVVAPYYNKPNRAGLLAHFAAVAEATPLPVIVYNIPSRCVINLAPDLLAELATIDNIVAVKQANNDEVQPIEGLALLAGNDDNYLATLEAGGAGGILVASHIVGPEMKHMHEAARDGEPERARVIDARLRPIYEATAVTANPIPIKAALNMLGIEVGGLRLPMVEADAQQREVVRSALERHGLLEASAA